METLEAAHLVHVVQWDTENGTKEDGYSVHTSQHARCMYIENRLNRNGFVGDMVSQPKHRFEVNSMELYKKAAHVGGSIHLDTLD